MVYIHILPLKTKTDDYISNRKHQCAGGCYIFSYHLLPEMPDLRGHSAQPRMFEANQSPHPQGLFPLAIGKRGRCWRKCFDRMFLNQFRLPET